MKIWRQGDILLIATEDKPTGKELPRDKGRVVLAYGEVTGHAHAITEPEVKGYGDVTINWIASPVLFTVQHEEHAAVEVPAGNYRVVRQSEYRRREIVRIAD